MKLNIRTAKTKLYRNATVYYVPSKSGGEEHIVVSTSRGLFCDCKDFMTRRLPLIGTSGFSNCIHGKQVVAMTMGLGVLVTTKLLKPNTVRPAKVKTRYGIFTSSGSYRSIDFPKEYSTKAAAEKVLRDNLDNGFRCVRTL